MKVVINLLDKEFGVNKVTAPGGIIETNKSKEVEVLNFKKFESKKSFNNAQIFKDEGLSR